MSCAACWPFWLSLSLSFWSIAPIFWLNSSISICIWWCWPASISRSSSVIGLASFCSNACWVLSNCNLAWCNALSIANLRVCSDSRSSLGRRALTKAASSTNCDSASKWVKVLCCVFSVDIAACSSVSSCCSLAVNCSRVCCTVSSCLCATTCLALASSTARRNWFSSLSVFLSAKISLLFCFNCSIALVLWATKFSSSLSAASSLLSCACLVSICAVKLLKLLVSCCWRSFCSLNCRFNWFKALRCWRSFSIWRS